MLSDWKIKVWSKLLILRFHYFEVLEIGLLNSFVLLHGKWVWVRFRFNNYFAINCRIAYCSLTSLSIDPLGRTGEAIINQNKRWTYPMKRGNKVKIPISPHDLHQSVVGKIKRKKVEFKSNIHSCFPFIFFVFLSIFIGNQLEVKLHKFVWITFRQLCWL